MKHGLFCLRLVFLLVFHFRIQAQIPSSEPKFDENIPSDFKSLLLQKPITVFVFFSPDCPLCQSYTKTLQELKNKFSTDSLHYVLVVQDVYKLEEMAQFKQTYKFDWNYVFDFKYSFAKAMKAKVTPESIVMNSSGSVLYQGAVDNQLEKLGKKRVVVTQHFLAEALSAILAHKKPETVKTEAVGCFLEY